MPDHVYHEVSIVATDEQRYWVSFGDGKGRGHVSEKQFIRDFVHEFTFDTRYEVDCYDCDDPPPEGPILPCFVSAGGSDWSEYHVYAYELERAGGYNWPLGGPNSDIGWTVMLRFGNDGSERLSLLAIAYALLAEAQRRREEKERDSG